MNQSQNKLGTTIGLVTLGGSVSGVASLVAALFPFFDGDYAGAGMCLLAAAMSFGLLANALLRD